MTQFSVSTSNDSYTLAGYSGNDTISGGNGNDVLWGALGSDSLTGGGGDDQFYYTDLLEGTDTITDFGQSGDRDKLLFAHNPNSSYARTSSAEVMSSIQPFDYKTNSFVLPSIFAFEDTTLYGVTSLSAVATTLANANFRIWFDQSNNIALGSAEYFLLTPGSSDSGINVFVWTDGERPNGSNSGTNNGMVESTELAHIAFLAGGDTSSVTGDEFAFQAISDFSV